MWDQEKEGDQKKRKRKGKERKEKERKGKERKGKERVTSSDKKADTISSCPPSQAK